MGKNDGNDEAGGSKSECKEIIKLQDLQEGIEKSFFDFEVRMRKFRSSLLNEQKRMELNNYRMIEAFFWLEKRMCIKGRLPPLRGWAISPDVLLDLHEHLMVHRPRLVVEFGSGSSTVVIADALRQNGFGKLVSLEHSEHYGGLTRESLRREHLEHWVDLRIGQLEPWAGEHLGRQEGQEDEAMHWYPARLLEGLEGIDMVLVDGPPGNTCQYARYPALPAVAERLSAEATVWMDDTKRQDERYICKTWAKSYGMTLKYIAYEKGLGILRRSTSVA